MNASINDIIDRSINVLSNRGYFCFELEESPYSESVYIYCWNKDGNMIKVRISNHAPTKSDNSTICIVNGKRYVRFPSIGWDMKLSCLAREFHFKNKYNLN